MKNFLVPIDFSEASRNTAKYAVSLAQIFNAKVIFLNVVPAGILLDDESALSRINAQAELIEGNKELVAKEIRGISKNSLVRIEGFVGEGSPSEVISKMATENDCELILMGMKGKGKSNSVFGSTTTDVIQRSTFSVLVIPESASYQSIETITFATDFDTKTEGKDYSLLMEIVQKFNSFIQVLNVQKNETKMSDSEFTGKMSTHLTFTDLKHGFATIEDTSVISGISNFIQKNPCDLLAMVARKHFFLKGYSAQCTPGK